MTKACFVHFAHQHTSFRAAELRALALIEGVNVDFDEAACDDENSCILKIRVASLDDARRLVRRSILIRNVYEIWAAASTFADMVDAARALPMDILRKHCHQKWRFTHVSTNHNFSQRAQRTKMEEFAFLPLPNAPSLHNAEIEYTIFEHFEMGPGKDKEPVLTEALFGVLLGSGSRALVTKYSLKTRAYIGTTSLDPEIALIMANIGGARPGAAVFEPFLGTGGLAVASAAFGAYTLGSDIDGRQIRGKGHERSVRANMDQYALTQRHLGAFVSDLSCTPLRQGAAIFDAIITDPPYGVRAGARQIGTKNGASAGAKADPRGTKFDTQAMPFNPHKSQSLPLSSVRYPETVVYPLENLLDDLLQFAAAHLREGARLVFLMPTAVDADQPIERADIPSHPMLDLTEVCEQRFTTWARVLVCYTKRSASRLIGEDAAGNFTDATKGHVDFRRRYFKL